MSLPIGIDIGTTFSCAAVYRKEKSEIIPNKEGDRLTPSFIYYHPESLEVSVGKNADDLGIQNMPNFLFDIKRIMGRNYNDAYIQELINTEEYCYKIVRGEDDNVEIELKHNKLLVRKTPKEICSEIFKYLKESASKYLGAEVTEAVISVPAYSSNAQRKAIKVSAELAGLKVLKLITDPVAGAIHYSEYKLDKKSTVLVFDLGGGTLDVSLIEVEKKSFLVKSVEGDTFLGGTNLDELLIKKFKSAIKMEFDESVFNDRLLRRLKDTCISLKKQLSLEQNGCILFYCIGGNEDNHFTLSMTKTEFEQISKHLFNKVLHLVEKCLRKSGISKKQITDVLLVGGSTRIPKVREMLTTYFGSSKIRTDLNPDEAVALGAAIQAALLKNKSEELEKYKITEIAPFSIGIQLDNNLMQTLIEKNSLLPIKSSPYTCHAMENDQKSCKFEIYEGERKNCKYNNLLGKFFIDNLPTGKAGDIPFEVVFSLDENGILEINAQKTSENKKLILTLGEYQLCDYKVRQEIEDEKQIKKDDQVFAKFIYYLWKVRIICDYVLNDVEKIKLDSDRNFVKSECKRFLKKISDFNYRDIKNLKMEYKTFIDSIKQAVQVALDPALFEDINGTWIQSLGDLATLSNRTESFTTFGTMVCKDLD